MPKQNACPRLDCGSERVCAAPMADARTVCKPQELVLPPTEGEHHDAGAVADDRAAEPHRLEVPDSPAAGTAPASPDPLTEAEYDAIVGTIWNELDGDPHRFDDLLAEALAFIAGIALREDTDPHEADRATAALRDFEQRALWGPTNEQENHR